MHDAGVHARQRVHEAVEAAVREAAELAGRSNADGEARLQMLVDGWGRALTAALEELAVSLDELHRLVRPSEPELEPAPTPPPPEQVEGSPPPAADESKDQDEDETEEQLRARAEASRAETEALREETP